MEGTRKIVIMGGSFNPPTIAHFEIMKAAMKGTGAERGIFVPVSQAYLKRKMRKAEGCRICITAQLRLSMLLAMCRDHAGLSVSEVDLYTARVCAYQTMDMLQQEYPDHQLLYLAGADKLELIRKWDEDSDFFERFGIALVCRNEVGMETLLAEKDRIQPGRMPFVLIPQPEEINEVSSTAVRRCMIENRMGDAGKYLHPEVWEQYKQLQLSDFPPIIERFQGVYDFLDNRYPTSFSWEGCDWLCAEAAIQAARCARRDQALSFVRCGGKEARRRSDKVVPREDWKDVCLSLTEEILTEKFRQNPDLLLKLKETGNAVLVAGNNGKETFWGVKLYTDQGDNHLGKLLMKVREGLPLPELHASGQRSVCSI